MSSGSFPRLAFYRCTWLLASDGGSVVRTMAVGEQVVLLAVAPGSLTVTLEPLRLGHWGGHTAVSSPDCWSGVGFLFFFHLVLLSQVHKHVH